MFLAAKSLYAATQIPELYQEWFDEGNKEDVEHLGADELSAGGSPFIRALQLFFQICPKLVLS